MVERLLAVAIAALLLVGLVGVATVDDESEQIDTAGATSTTLDGDGGDDPVIDITGTSAPGPAGTTATTSAALGGTATTRAGSGPATTGAPAGKDPGPAQPPKLGLYRYNTKKNESQTTTEVRVERDTAQVPGEQRFTLHIKEGESNNTLSDLIAWRSDGIYLRMTTFPNPGGGPPVECDWEPDLLDRKLPTKAGQEWDVDSTCRMTFGAATGTFHLKGHGKVEGARRVTVAGQTIDTWLVTQSAHLDIDLVYNGQPIHAENDTTTQDYWSAPRGITVKTNETSVSKDPSGKTTNENTTRELQRLEPTP